MPVLLTLALLGGCATTPPPTTGFLGEDWQPEPEAIQPDEMTRPAEYCREVVVAELADT